MLKSIDPILFRPRSLKKITLNRHQNLFGGALHYQDPLLYTYIVSLYACIIMYIMYIHIYIYRYIYVHSNPKNIGKEKPTAY